MVIPINERLLSGRKLYISQNGTGGPVIFWGMYPHRGNEVEHLRESLMEIAPGQNFMLVAFQVTVGSTCYVWNRKIFRTGCRDIEMAYRRMHAIY